LCFGVRGFSELNRGPWEFRTVDQRLGMYNVAVWHIGTLKCGGVVPGTVEAMAPKQDIGRFLAQVQQAIQAGFVIPFWAYGVLAWYGRMPACRF
jgi:hypothetical protein